MDLQAGHGCPCTEHTPQPPLTNKPTEHPSQGADHAGARKETMMSPGFHSFSTCFGSSYCVLRDSRGQDIPGPSLQEAYSFVGEIRL